MITQEMVERVAKKCKEMNPNDWMSSVGLTPEAERYLKGTAAISDVRGTSAEAIRMVGFQIGYELGLQVKEIQSDA